MSISPAVENMISGNDDVAKIIILSDPYTDNYDKLVLLGYIVLMLMFVMLLQKLKMFTVVMTMRIACWQQQ